jgi:hypothetical protein
MLLTALFVPALALAAGASVTGDTNKITGQAAANGSTNTNDKSTTTGDSAQSSSKSSTAADAFAQLDTNHDGKLSAAEAAADPQVQGMWKKFDVNNDGTVSQAEFAAHEAELK